MNEENDSDKREERKKKRRTSTSDDAEELRAIAEALPEMFSAINEAVPKLISGLIGSIYSPEAAGNMAAAVGRFYSKLIEEGIPKEVALDMTQKFVGALDFKSIMNLVSEEAAPRRKRQKGVRFDDEDDEDLDEFE